MLGTGWLLIFVPASRHPATLFAVAVVALWAGMLYPEPALLVTQAASLGLALTLLAGLLQRSVSRRRRGAGPYESSSWTPEKGSTATQHQAAVPPNRLSTETASPSVPLSASDSDS